MDKFLINIYINSGVNSVKHFKMFITIFHSLCSAFAVFKSMYDELNHCKKIITKLFLKNM